MGREQDSEVIQGDENSQKKTKVIMTEVFFTQRTSVNITFNNAKCVKLHIVLCLATGSNERVIIVRPQWKQLRALQSAVMKKRIFLSALTNRSADAIGALIPKHLSQPARYL